jgi:two-component system, sensor histidine kinase
MITTSDAASNTVPDTGTSQQPESRPNTHPRTLGWVGTTALAMGGSNQSLFLMAALFIGQGDILGQGSAAVPLLIVGLLLSWMAAPGWTELVLMYPNRVGGIAATCAEAFRPYSPVLANLAGTCYWWGWVPTCGLTAILSASAINSWFLPDVPVTPMAVGLVLFFMGVNLCGVSWVSRLSIPIATLSASLALLSGLLPILSGSVDWHRAFDFHLTTPFSGAFGALTSIMAGLYLIGFAAPAFEAAACHVGETKDPNRNVPRAMFAAGAMAAVFFILLPVVWLGALGAEPLGKDLALVLGPTFAPLFGASAKAAAIWFMMLSMFHGTVQPLAGASRTLSQLAEDGLLPKFLALRSKTDAPWVATLLTAGMSIFFLLIGDPIWLIAAANFAYLIGITLPSVAVCLLRRDAPEMLRPYRAPYGTVTLGVVAAVVWGISAILGFQQFGLPTVLFGLVFAYSGTALYAARKFSDRRAMGLPGIAHSLHIKLTGAMLLVLVLDGAGYLLAVASVPTGHSALITGLEDIFVAVAMLTISVGLILPGMIAHSAVEVANAAERLARGTVADFSRAMNALGAGRLDDAYARVDRIPVRVHSRDEIGQMATSFNLLQTEIADAAQGLGGAREGLHKARLQVEDVNRSLAQRVEELHVALDERERAEKAADAANRAKSQFLANMSHEIRTPINGVLGMTELLLKSPLDQQQQEYASTVMLSGQSLLSLINDILDFSKIEAGKLDIDSASFDLRDTTTDITKIHRMAAIRKGLEFRFDIAHDVPDFLRGDALRLRQVLTNLLANAVKFTQVGHVGLNVSAQTSQHENMVVVAFQITDTGIGMSEEMLDKMFKPFTQADSSMARQYGGTGLGLVISRQLVGLMNGKLKVSSTLGAGSTFSFQIPFQVAEPFGSARFDVSTPPEKFSNSGRILLAEDNAVNRAIALAMLRGLDLTVDTAVNGVEAVQRVREHVYELVLMDCQMPELDGFSATMQIREFERAEIAAGRRVRVPIIAVTANAMQGDRERCSAAGMDDYLSKPYLAIDLRVVLARWISSARAISAS